MDGKYCPRCKQTLPLDEFAADGSRKDGKAAYCLIDDKCRKYGISRSRYLSMLSLQGGKCAFPGCDRVPDEIDHDHLCCSKKQGCEKCVRAILCSKHNLALGQFSDDAEQMRQAINYLNEYDLRSTRLFEVLVPTQRNDGTPIRTRFHRVWDSKVRNVASGLTILHPAKGQWVSPDGVLFSERMIPVRVACTRPQILQILEMTLEHYEQQAIFATQVSDLVILRYRKDANV
jgi:hypothetical protein